MKAMDLMDEKLRPISHDTELLAQVYQGIGNVQGAIDAYQAAVFQHLIFLVSDSAPLALLNAADFAKAEQIITRAIGCIFYKSCRSFCGDDGGDDSECRKVCHIDRRCLL